jgi:hypothetical protein
MHVGIAGCGVDAALEVDAATTPDAGTTSDAAVVADAATSDDASVPTLDASVRDGGADSGPRDASAADAAPDAATTVPPVASGCGCRAGGRTGSGSLVALVALALLAGRFPRSQRRRRTLPG